jgi:hypothetical protein
MFLEYRKNIKLVFDSIAQLVSDKNYIDKIILFNFQY